MKYIQGKIGEEEEGFTAGEIMRRPDIHIAKDHRKERSEEQKIQVAFVDCRKAYDTTHIQDKFKALSQLEIPKA